MANLDQIQIDYNGRDKNNQIVIDMTTLLKIATENGYLDGKLVVDFYDDWYDGLTYEGIFLRKKD